MEFRWIVPAIVLLAESLGVCAVQPPGGALAGDRFRVIPAAIEDPPRASRPETNPVQLRGRSLCGDNVPFLRLGASCFQALRHAKFDRTRLDCNLASPASNGFNYVRVLSRVNWDGLERAPVTFTNRAGRMQPSTPANGSSSPKDPMPSSS